MPEPQTQGVHRRFAAECFNGVWDLLDKEDRSEDDLAEMIHMAHASVWHWRHSEEGTAQRLAVGAWQLSRVYAVAGRSGEAIRYGEESRRLCEEHGLAPFYRAYAHEALARAAAVAGNASERERHLADAEAVAERVEDESDRQALLDDLATI